MAKITFTLNDDVAAAVKKFAEKREISTDEAGNKLFTVAIGRLGALARYAKTHPADPQPKAKAKKAKAKAKGPIARKAKKAKAETPEQAQAAVA